MFALVHWIGFGMGLLLFPFALLLTAFWIWMLIDAATNEAVSDGEKIAWVLIILFLHFPGAVIYCFVGRPKRRAVKAIP